MSRSHDLLLAWLSARGTVSEASADDACRALAGRKREDPEKAWLRLLEPLFRLGHVERSERGWRVAAATLIWRGSEDGEGELYGSRDNSLADELARSLGQGFSRFPQESGPEVWRVHGQKRQVRETCAELGLRWNREGSATLLRALPTTHSALIAVPPSEFAAEFFFSRQWSRFEVLAAQGPSWRKLSAGVPAWGLLRSEEPKPTVYVWLDEVEAVRARRASRNELVKVRKLPKGELRHLARWAVIAEAGALRLLWRRLESQLCVPAVHRAPLPVLVDRALRLGGGSSPRERWDPAGRRTDTYEQVSETKARDTARILGVQLDIA